MGMSCKTAQKHSFLSVVCRGRTALPPSDGVQATWQVACSPTNTATMPSTCATMPD